MGGVSSARNFGISQAKGKWITFIDADDWIAEDYIQKLMEATEGVDFVISGFQYVQNDGTKVYTKRCDIVKPDIYVTLGDEIFCKPYLMSTPWCKLYKLKIINENNMQFDEQMIIGEDNCFVNDYLCNSKRVKFIDYAGYRYRLAPYGGVAKKYKLTPQTFDYHIGRLISSFEKVSEVLNIDLARIIEQEKKIFCNLFVDILNSLSYKELRIYIKEIKKNVNPIFMNTKFSRSKRMQLHIALGSPLVFYIVSEIQNITRRKM